MSKWKCGICNSEFDNYQAQGFNRTIYCPLCYFKELYKREKNKIDKAIEFVKEHNIIGTNKEYLPSEIEKCYSLELMEILRGEDNEGN